MSDYLASLNAWSSPLEMGVILLTFLLLFGAKQLPEMLRTIGRWMEQIRRLSDEFRSQLLEADHTLTRKVEEEWENTMEEQGVAQGSEEEEKTDTTVSDDDESVSRGDET